MSRSFLLCKNFANPSVFQRLSVHSSYEQFSWEAVNAKARRREDP